MAADCPAGQGQGLSRRPDDGGYMAPDRVRGTGQGVPGDGGYMALGGRQAGGDTDYMSVEQGRPADYMSVEQAAGTYMVVDGGGRIAVGSLADAGYMTVEDGRGSNDQGYAAVGQRSTAGYLLMDDKEADM